MFKQIIFVWTEIQREENKTNLFALKIMHQKGYFQANKYPFLLRKPTCTSSKNLEACMYHFYENKYQTNSSMNRSFIENI